MVPNDRIEANLTHESWSSIAREDVKKLIAAEKSYGDSWKRRGGVDSFMMLARKWDRLEHQVQKHGWNVLQAATVDTRPEGILDDIRDLRRYLILVEAEVLARQQTAAEPGREYVAQG